MKTVNRNNFFVVTGGPGMGKTSLLEEMKRRGYYCIEETGRQVIQDQIRVKGEALPWKSPLLFAELLFKQDLDNFMNCREQQQAVLFDRGIPDVMGYLKLNNIRPLPHMIQNADQLRYNPLVLITPPWEEIYINDTERKQSFTEAVDTYKMMVDIYTRLDYQLLEIPRISVKDRADFMIKAIGF